MYIFVLQIFLFNLVNTEFFISWNNVTFDATPQITGRVKRYSIDEIPDLLYIKIKYGNSEGTAMKWRKYRSFVANGNLPVFVSLTNHQSEVMKNFGEFVSFYDVSNCSAVVYFQKSNSFYGVIGTDYYIENLPYNFDIHGKYLLPVVGDPYIKKHRYPLNHINPQNFIPQMSYTNFREDYLHPSDSSPEIDNNHVDYDGTVNSRDTRDNRITANQPSLNYICETLIFVARDIADDFLGQYGPDHYIEWIVRYYIVYFHAVDMIFKATFASNGIIQMNIAKICIETNQGPFNFLNNDILRYSEVITKLPNYFFTFSEYYPEDSFDYVFIHTRRSIWDGTVRRSGVTKRSHDLTHARKNNQFYNAVPVTIMGYENFLADYVTTVQAIGEIFGINLDPPTRGLTAYGQCHSIMQMGGARCSNCLRWSEANRNQLNAFLKTNPNRCSLMNFPRSLKKPKPSRLISPNVQCTCYGYDYYRMLPSGLFANYILRDECANHLFCKQLINESVVSQNTGISPFDGTSCGNSKICWKKKCVSREN